MDRRFFDYYEDELVHIRRLAGEFAEDHRSVAQALSLTNVPCPDPYVERLLEGVAYLAARTRLKLDLESGRHVRLLLEALYPDIVGPGPAMTIAQLAPGPQVGGMPDGYVVRRGTRLVAGLTEVASTRAVYTTVQDVHLWPIRIGEVRYLSDRGSLRAAGLSDADVDGAVAGLLVEIGREAPGRLDELSLDELVLSFAQAATAPGLFDAVFGSETRTLARGGRKGRFVAADRPRMVGLSDDEAILPRTQPSFSGFRVLREYLLMPARFFYARLHGLNPAVRSAGDGPLQVLLTFRHGATWMSEVRADDFALFTAPIVNLFPRECDVVELDRRKSAQVIHVDRKRPQDFEIYQVLRVEDVEGSGPDAVLHPLYTLGQKPHGAHVYTLERRPAAAESRARRRNPNRRGYQGDDVLISVSRTPGPRLPHEIRRLDILALCTNRDLPMIDRNPTLTLETGDPVAGVRLLQEVRRPQPALVLPLPQTPGQEREAADLTWRWISQLGLNHVSMAETWTGADPIRALLGLYADSGDPSLARHADAISRVKSRRVMERLDLPGPNCFGHGTEVTLEVDDGELRDSSALLLSALLAHVLSRQCAVNSFVRTKTLLTTSQREIRWPMVPGNRASI